MCPTLDVHSPISSPFQTVDYRIAMNIRSRRSSSKYVLEECSRSSVVPLLVTLLLHFDHLLDYDISSH